jgi:hypothetical protein
VMGSVMHLAFLPATITGAAVCFILRFMAIHRDWHLPVAHPPEPSSPEK